jgi:hypothetical protein
MSPGASTRKTHWVCHLEVWDVAPTRQGLDLGFDPHLNQPWVLFNKLTLSEIILPSFTWLLTELSPLAEELDHLSQDSVR